MREVVATARKPVILYSIGIDSSVMVRIAERPHRARGLDKVVKSSGPVRVGLIRVPAFRDQSELPMGYVGAGEHTVAASQSATQASQTVPLGQVLMAADQHRQAGRLHEAEQLCRQILATHPRCGAAEHILGHVAYQAGRLSDAIWHICHAIELEPKVAIYHANIGEMYRLTGRAELAAEAARRALQIEPNHIGGLNNLGVALYDLHEYQQALDCYDRVVALKPDFVEAMSNRGNALRALGRLLDAENAYRRAIELDPQFAQAWDNLGTTLLDLKRANEAAPAYERAMALDRTKPSYGIHLANLLLEYGKAEAAAPIADRVLELDPVNAEGVTLKGRVAFERGDADEAMKVYARALELNPKLAEAHNNLGNVLKSVGRLEEARAAFREALEIDPKNAAFHFNLADTRQFSPDDPDLAAMQALDSEGNLSPLDQMRLDFALGKAYADFGDHARAFEHLRKGNAAKRASISYDETAKLDGFRQIKEVFTPALLEQYSGVGDASRLPIFILGMPRSGTTLVEQILASHPQIHGAGELKLFSELANGVDRQAAPPRDYPDNVRRLDGEMIRHIGSQYLEKVRALVQSSPGAVHVTDKMPANFFFVGLIHLALPNAAIIHTMRDPVDTCLSCFSKLFTSEQNFSYELAELGRYYREYRSSDGALA